MMSYSLSDEFPDMAARFERLSHDDPEFSALLASYYAVDAQITALSGSDALAQLPTLASQRLRLKESLYRQLLCK
ncbi:YdcH family protein [Tolumonas lignilytica]|jgi:hypothetical protein|uniref:YdcH family protein n=1 Tax=Tolumonas lignilytica TaxID=1283284 RepID=UPI000465E743|nr:hypothetical protein [Tolumonas lignilytica]